MPLHKLVQRLGRALVSIGVNGTLMGGGGRELENQAYADLPKILAEEIRLRSDQVQLEQSESALTLRAGRFQIKLEVGNGASQH